MWPLNSPLKEDVTSKDSFAKASCQAMPRTKPPLGKRQLVRTLRRFRHVSLEMEAALMDPDPEVRIRAQLPLCAAVIEDPATSAEARELLKFLIDEARRVLPRVQ